MSARHKRDVAGKDPWHLLPYDALRGIVKGFAFGSHTHGERDWERGYAWSDYHGAMMRHMAAWWQREGVDEKSRHSHLWHAGCCILILIAYELRGIGDDDRPGPNVRERAGDQLGR
jgi:hypothetical protein